MLKLRFFISALFAGFAPLLFHVAAHACAVCVTGADNDPLTDAFNWSVIFLMATPYTIVGSIGAFLFYSHRRSVTKPREQSESATISPLAWIRKESET